MHRYAARIDQIEPFRLVLVLAWARELEAGGQVRFAGATMAALAQIIDRLHRLDKHAV